MCRGATIPISFSSNRALHMVRGHRLFWRIRTMELQWRTASP